MKIKSLILATFLTIPTLFANCSLDATKEQESNLKAQPTRIVTEPKPISSPLMDVRYYPETAIMAFYKALKTKNRRVAIELAPGEVVDQLFENKHLKLDWKSFECKKSKEKEKGDVKCDYLFEGGGIHIFLRKGKDENYQIVSTSIYD